MKYNLTGSLLVKNKKFRVKLNLNKENIVKNVKIGFLVFSKYQVVFGIFMAKC